MTHSSLSHFLDFLPVLDPGSRLFYLSLLGSFTVASIFIIKTYGLRVSTFKRIFLNKNYWLNSSAKLDYAIFVLNGLMKLFFFAPLVGVTYFFSKYTIYFLVQFNGGPGHWQGLWWQMSLMTLLVFVWDDFLRFTHHYLMHKVPILWHIHKTHHSASVLTPMTLYRIHPLESLLASLRNGLSLGVSNGVLIFLFSGQVQLLTLLGVNLFGFLFNSLTGNLRHSHIPISFGFAEYLLISPKQHQIHHSRNSQHYDKNFGVALSIWDLIFGTLILSKKEKITSFGVEGLSASDLLSQLLPKPPSWLAFKQLSLGIILIFIAFGFHLAKAQSCHEVFQRQNSHFIKAINKIEELSPSLLQSFQRRGSPHQTLNDLFFFIKHESWKITLKDVYSKLGLVL